MPLAVLLTIVLLATSSFAEDSLCNQSERTLFSCHIGKKEASLCHRGKPGGSLIYRFGTKNIIEMVYANNHSKTFFRQTVPMYGGGITYVGFLNGDYEYKIYSKVSKSDEASPEDRVPVFEDGIIVLRRGKQIKQFVCDDGGEGFRESIDWLPAKK